MDALAPETVVVYGVAQDVCDAQAIAGFLRRGGVRVVFVEDAARPIDAARGAALLEEWRSRGVTSYGPPTSCATSSASPSSA